MIHLNVVKNNKTFPVEVREKTLINIVQNRKKTNSLENVCMSSVYGNLCIMKHMVMPHGKKYFKKIFAKGISLSREELVMELFKQR